MKKTLISFFLVISFISCNKPFQITESKVEAYNEKILNEPTFSSYYFSNFYPVFSKNRFIQSVLIIKNNSGQTLEELYIRPSLEISFKNDINYILPIVTDTLLINLDPGDELEHKKIFQIDSLEKFKEEILLHNAQKAVLKLEIVGKNSIGYNSAEEEKFIYEKDLTDQWNYLHDFHKGGKFKNSSEAFRNYTKQLDISMENFNAWDKEFLEKYENVFHGKHAFLKAERIRTRNFNIRNFDEYQNVLISNLLKDLKFTTSVSPELESYLEKFVTSKNEMWSAKINMNSELLGFLQYKDSIRDLNPRPRNYEVRLGLITKGEFNAKYKSYTIKQQEVLEKISRARDSFYRKAQDHQASFDKHKMEALTYYSQFHNQMIEVLKLEDFVENYKVF